MSFGDAWAAGMGNCDKKTSFEILDYFFAQGGNFIDTANNYQSEESETWLGEWMAPRGVRDQIVLATKYTTNYNVHRGHDGIQQRNTAATAANRCASASRPAFGSCRPTTSTCCTSTGGTTPPAWKSSCTRSTPSSKPARSSTSASPTPRPWVVAKANQYARDHGLRPSAVYQGRYNAAVRDMERDIIPMCLAEGMGIDRGFKSEAQRQDAGGRKMYGPASETERRVSAALQKLAHATGTLITSVALAYVMHKAPYMFPVCGGRKVEHLQGNIEALGVALSAEEMREIEDAGDYSAGFPHNMLQNMLQGMGGAWGPEDVVMSKAGGTVDLVERPKPIAPQKL
ncbi:hypothetical protein MMC13_000960 [Lambiella insularis]|nr:hypothetical protein [Lambiella insularis]